MTAYLKAPRRKVGKFRSELLAWYMKHGRAFPWRSNSDPYRISVAEILLQKTNAEKAEVAFRHILRCYPTVAHLARARGPVLNRIIEPIGLSYRSDRLIRIARVVVNDHQGRFPPDAETLQSLPGVGRYISSSIRCFAFGEIVAVLDTNVIRILDRVFSIRSRAARPRDDRSLWRVAEVLTSTKHPREYNWALLDLGATVCTKRSPRCPECPLRQMCAFRSNATTTRRRTGGNRSPMGAARIRNAEAPRTLCHLALSGS